MLYGGSFDPIHHGHLIVARHAAEALGAARVVLIPSRTPPHKRGRTLAPPEARLALCAAAVSDDPLFTVSDWELRQSGPNYTILTVTHFRAAWPETALSWLIGLDSLHELPTWHRVGELVDLCRMVTVSRPGQPAPVAARLVPPLSQEQAAVLLQQVIEGPRIDISATAIRARVRQGHSIRYLVPAGVEALIHAHGLYQQPGMERGNYGAIG